MLDWDRPLEAKGEFRFAALQSQVGKALLKRGGRRDDDISSIVLATAGENAAFFPVCARHPISLHTTF
jgi:predicted DCC family thiol-disulfide oxidoreductase YuxK